MNVVLDIESLSLKPNAVILSLGAVAENGEVFYKELNWREQEQEGRAIDVSTCLWWGTQPAELCPLNGHCSLQEALQEFKDWLSAYPVEDLMIWARGPQFDIVVLEHAFRMAAISVPWIYKNVRDVRTALACSPITTLYEPTHKHHALHDAIADMKNLAVRGFTTYDLSLS